MNQENELITIESKFNVSTTKINSLFAWPLLRQKIYFDIVNQKFQFSSKLRTRNKIQLIKNSLFGWRYLFKLRKFDYLFFNNADKRTLKKNNKHYDVFFDAFADKLGQDNALFIEWAIKRHYPRKQTYSKNVISDIFVKYGCLLCSIGANPKIESIEEIEKIKTAYNLDFDIIKYLNEKYAEIRFYRFLFNWIKPKTIFIISGFTKVSLIIAAHLLDIKVIEAQHGYIGKNHQFYIAHKNFGTFYYPDFLIAFGSFEKNYLPRDFIFHKDQILPVGSLYLEDIKNHYSDAFLEELSKKYTKIFCVTLQTVKEVELLQWVNSEAAAHPNWLFILKPRNKNFLDYSNYVQLENTILLQNYNIYQVLKYSHYNITIYSTTAVEASFFNVKTLFYNIEGLSDKYFEIDCMYADRINPRETLTEDNLSLNMDNILEYFISDYKNNIKSISI